MIANVFRAPKRQHADAGEVHFGNSVWGERVVMVLWIVVELVVDEPEINVEVLDRLTFDVGETEQTGLGVEQGVPMFDRRDSGEGGRRRRHLVGESAGCCSSSRKGRLAVLLYQKR